MTDRHAGYIVILKNSVRSDDDLRKTLMNIKGVIDVEPITDNADIAIAYSRARTELTEKLFSVLSG